MPVSKQRPKKPRPPKVNPWVARVWAEFRAGNLTWAFKDALLTLRTFRGPGGIYPKHETVAEQCGAGVRTVQRAFDQAAALDMLAWEHRRVRVGWRSLRTSSIYRLILPKAPCVPTTGQLGRGGESKVKKEAQGVQKALAAVRSIVVGGGDDEWGRGSRDRQLRELMGGFTNGALLPG